jgi:hypothetical protein
MSLLTELLDSIPKSEFDEKVKIICDKIMLEERSADKQYMPIGANIFLAVQFGKPSSSMVNFLCLEREMKETYIVSLWEKTRSRTNQATKRIQTWPVPVTESGSAEKILKFYALKLKYLKGE